MDNGHSDESEDYDEDYFDEVEFDCYDPYWDLQEQYDYMTPYMHPFCQRCGHISHTIESCFAKWNIYGERIVDYHETPSNNLCLVCGQENHSSQECTNFEIEEEIEEIVCERSDEDTHITSNGNETQQDCYIYDENQNGETFCHESPDVFSNDVEIIDLEEDEPIYCQRCESIGHKYENCTAIYSIFGELLSDEEDVNPKREYVVDSNDVFYNHQWFPLIIENLTHLPNSPAVYEIAQCNIKYKDIARSCAYVGHTGDLKERLTDHCKEERWDGRQFRISNIRIKKQEAEKKGYHLLFRYVLMKSKGEAEAKEQYLLSSYDYAWNLAGNNKKQRRTIETSF